MIIMVYLLSFANVIIIAGRYISPERRYMELFGNTRREDPTILMNHAAPKHLKSQVLLQKINANRVKTASGKTTKELFSSTIKTDTIDQINPTTTGPIMRSDANKNPLQPKMIARQGKEKTTHAYRSTSEDMLRWLLKQKLTTDDPAPAQIGQMPIDVMLPVSQPLWIFEDYEDASSVSDLVRDQNEDCEGQMIQCTQNTEKAVPVCVDDLSIPLSVAKETRQKGFHDVCQVEYRNCLKRYELTGKYYADHYTEDYLQFLHYGWCDLCKYHPNGC